MQIPILNGIKTDASADFRSSYPRNLVPVPVSQGISGGYLRPTDGIVQDGTGPGADRGGIAWNGRLYRVMGAQLVRIAADGTLEKLGDVGDDGKPVTMDYSFDVLAIASAGHLLYFDGSTLTTVTDSDLGNVVDSLWVDGYFMTTDGTSLIVTELNDRMSVNPLKYGSSEADPDPIVSELKLRGEVWALNRYTTQVFQNVGGENFPFAVVPGATVPRGCIGTQACNLFLGSIAMVGSGRNESPAVWLMQSADTVKLSTREVDIVLQGYSEQQLSEIVVEARVDKGHQHLMVHLPDQTLVYDGAASLLLKEPVWFTLTSSLEGQGRYRARSLVWCYDRWNVGDPTSGAFGHLDSTVPGHYGQPIGWQFDTQVLYNEGMGAIVHSVELVALTGRAAPGADPTIWSSWSFDGMTYSQERPIRAGRAGERQKRLQWRSQGHLKHWRTQRFRGTSDFCGSFARLELNVEPLSG